MSITQLYSNDQFFQTSDPRSFSLGQLCWVPVPNPNPIPRILDIQRNRPEEHEEVRFELREASRIGDFKRMDRGLPIKYLNIKSNEELLTQTCKKRPAVILSSGVDCFPEISKLLKQKGKKHQQQDCIFVIPCYSVQKEAYGPGFVQPIVARAQCLLYRQFFYIPQNKRFSELIARFDRIQIVIDRGPAAIEPTDVCLSEEIFNLLMAMFLYCISGQTSDELQATKELLKEAMPDEYK